MYHFINRGTVKHTRSYPKQNYIFDRYIKNRDRLIDYYRSRPQYIPNDHILVKIIKVLRVFDYTDLSVYEVISKARSEGYDIANSLNITTYKDVGRIEDSDFFNPGDKDILVFLSYADRDIDTDNWKNIVPVRVLWHDYISMQTPYLNGSRMFGRSMYGLGYNVVGIEPGLLYFMYSRWKEEIWSTYPDDEKPTVANFVAQYILPNMFDSFTDIAYFNRLCIIDRSNRDAINEVDNTHPVFAADISRHVDDSIEYMLNVSNFNTTSDTLLSLFVTPTGKSLMDVWEIDEQIHTRQIDWSLTIARVVMMGWVVERGMVYNMSMDAKLRNELLRRIRTIKYNNLFPSVFGSDARYINDFIDEYIYSKIEK